MVSLCGRAVRARAYRLRSGFPSMAGDQAKKAARRKAEAMQRWGGVAGGIFAVTLILHLFFFKASLSSGNYFGW